MADFKFKYCSYAVRLRRALHAAAIRLRTRLRRDKGGWGISSPKVALVEQISSLLSPEKAAEGETLRHMSRTTTTHAYHLPVQNPACAGARGAGGGVSTPAKTHRFCNSPMDCCMSSYLMTAEPASGMQLPSVGLHSASTAFSHLKGSAFAERFIT